MSTKYQRCPGDPWDGRIVACDAPFGMSGKVINAVCVEPCETCIGGGNSPDTVYVTTTGFDLRSELNGVCGNCSGGFGRARLADTLTGLNGFIQLDRARMDRYGLHNPPLTNGLCVASPPFPPYISSPECDCRWASEKLATVTLYGTAGNGCDKTKILQYAEFYWELYYGALPGSEVGYGLTIARVARVPNFFGAGSDLVTYGRFLAAKWATDDCEIVDPITLTQIALDSASTTCLSDTCLPPAAPGSRSAVLSV